jgi:tRNA pseudouridine55 synthase
VNSRAAAGLLPVTKPSGPTSREIVDQVVRGLGIRRVGHAGTLDPFAEGLLIIVWGRATSLVPYLHDYPKTYLARVRFGRVTDTQDRTGTVLEENEPTSLTREVLEQELPRFRGNIEQIPPMYSALKHGGSRLYDLARRGVEVSRKPRIREVHRFELISFDPPWGEFEIVCSSGTYVRTLAHDLGQAVKVGGSLDRLVRTAIGPFRLDRAIPAGELSGMDRAGLLERAWGPADALPDWPVITVPSEEARAVSHGSWQDPLGRTGHSGCYRVLDEEGQLLALARGGETVKLLRVFAGESGS